MGQYYKPILLDAESKKIIASFTSWDFDNGAKLMEHSYLNNRFVNVVCNEIIKRGGKARLIWAGDYAKGAEQEFVEQLKGAISKEKFDEVEGIIKERGTTPNLYSIVSLMSEGGASPVVGKNHADETPRETMGYRYIVNETKGLFIDLEELLCCDGWTIHPLPLLTCGYEANGQGGGDYDGINLDLVGSWCGDVISFRKPNDRYPISPIAEGFTEFKPKFAELGALRNDIVNKVGLLSKLSEDDKNIICEYGYFDNTLEELKAIVNPPEHEQTAPKF